VREIFRAGCLASPRVWLPWRCWRQAVFAARLARRPLRQPQSGEPVVVRSNILRADYAGSASCQSCHRSLYADWLGSPMRQMTRMPATAKIRAPFDGRIWRFKDDEARFEQQAGTRFVRIRSRRFGEHLYRVTRVIGGRTREDFAGIEVTGTQPDARIIGDAHDEVILPASYFFETASFRLKGYSVMVRERPGLKAGAVWNQSCVLCHNTAPILRDTVGCSVGQGRAGLPGRVGGRASAREPTLGTAGNRCKCCARSCRG
jgi:hypothetical protein